MTGDVLKLQAKIGRDERSEEIEDQVGTIWEGIIMEKHISIQGTSLDIHAKERIGKIKSGCISETSIIKVDLQTTISMVKKIYKDKIRPMYSPKKEVESIRTGIINTPSLEQWSEYMDSAINPVLLLPEKGQNI